MESNIAAMEMASSESLTEAKGNANFKPATGIKDDADLKPTANTSHRSTSQDGRE
ncbi:MAG: hypothetical protein LBH87_03625 [Coriobacteriales bacterium]|jgi:hypothetical protein|nr:hypothetical protein [Coriobacteriales bacterium]